MAPALRLRPLRAVAAAAAAAAALPRPAEAASWTTHGGLNCYDGDKGGIRVQEATYDLHNPVHVEGMQLEELTLDECKDRCVAESLCQGVLTIHRHVLASEPEEGPCWLRKHLQPSECIINTPWDLHVLTDRSSFDAKLAAASDYVPSWFYVPGWLRAASAEAGVPEWVLLAFIVLLLIWLLICLVGCLFWPARARGKAASGHDTFHLDNATWCEDDDIDTDTGRICCVLLRRWLGCCCCCPTRRRTIDETRPRDLIVDVGAPRAQPVYVARLGGAEGSLGVDTPGYGPMVVPQSYKATANSWDYGSRPAVVATGYGDYGGRGLGQPFSPSYLHRY